MVADELQKRSVPCPRTHFMLCSSTSMISVVMAHHKQPTVTEITVLFEVEAMKVKCDPRHGQYTA